MTRILVQRGSSSGSSSNQSRGPSSSSRNEAHTTATSLVPPPLKDEEMVEEPTEQVIVDELSPYYGGNDEKIVKSDEHVLESYLGDRNEALSSESGESDFRVSAESLNSEEMAKGSVETTVRAETEGTSSNLAQATGGNLQPPPPPVPPPKPLATNSNLRRSVSGGSNAVRSGSSRRGWPVISTRSSPTGSRPSSPRSHVDSEGYNSADEQGPCFASYDDLERERQFELDIRRFKGLEVRRMLEDGNCLFRAVADQVYGDSESHDLVRQMCIDYMERERDHFSQFITEGFTSYCQRKRRDKVYGNNMEIQALSEMYNRPIHIYSYTTEPINIFHGSYNTDLPPLRLSYHHGNHYNSLVDPRRSNIGAGLGFGSLRGRNVDKDQVKAAIKAQQDQQIDNALLAEGRFYSDLELTEKEIERMVMEASRAEYLASEKKQHSHRGSPASGAEPSSSGGRPSGSESNVGGGKEHGLPDTVLCSSMQIILSMGFSYLQAAEAYSIFGDDVDSMVCYLIETSSSSRRKGKAAE